MTKRIQITIKNKLSMEKRDLNIYHHADRSVHMISYNSSLSLALGSVNQDDYLHISLISGPGNMEGNCLVNLPSWVDFELNSAANITISHSGHYTLIRIPPGPPVWQLKMTRSLSSSYAQNSDAITIGDDKMILP